MVQPDSSSQDTEAAWSLRLASDVDLGFRMVALSGDRALVAGRSPDVDLVIPSELVSRRHTELRIAGGELLVRDLGSINGTFINDRRVDEGRARGGDRLCFGPLCFEVVAPKIETGATAVMSMPDTVRQRQSGTQVMPVATAQLLGRSPPLKGKRLPLAGRSVRAGRAADNSLVVEHDSVSAHHAEFRYLNGEWRVHDLASTNGTHIDGNRVTDAALRPGQRLLLGHVEFEFSLKGQQPRKTGTDPVVQASVRRRRPWLLGSLLLACLLLLLAYPPPFVQQLLPREALAVHTELQREMESRVRRYANQLSDDSGAPLSFAAPWPPRQFDRSRNFVAPALLPLRRDASADIVLVDSRGGLTAIAGDSGEPLFELAAGAKVVAPPGALTLPDGRRAVIVARYDGRVALYDGAGKRLWLSAEGLNLGKLVLRPLALDVNGDGHQDVVVVTGNRGVVALDGEREGWLLWDTAGMVRGDLTLPLAADINGDGAPDFVTASSEGQVLAFTLERGVPRKLWEQRIAPVMFAAPVLIEAGGQTLVAVAGHQRDIVALRADTGAVNWHRAEPKTLFASPLGADFDGDGSGDLMTLAHDGEVSAYRGDTGERLWHRELGVEVQADALLFDFNLDGSADIAVLDTAGGLHLLDGRRGGPLVQSSRQGEGFVSSPLLADVDGNGQVDLILISETGALSVLGVNRRLLSPRQAWPVVLGNDLHVFRP